MRYLFLFLLLLSISVKAQLFQQIGTLPVGGSLVELDFISPTQGFAAVNYYCLKSIDGGLQWSTISSEQVGGAYTYTAMAVVDSNHIYLGKNSGGRLKYTKNGSTWLDIQVGLNKAIRAISFLDTLQGYMLLGGNSGSVDSVFIMKTMDGGDSWNRLTTLPARGYDPKMQFTSSTHGLVYYQEKLFYTTDGGNNWLAATGIADNINRVSMLNDSTGMLAGRLGYLAYTNDRGANWTTIPLNSSRHIWDIKVFSSAEAYALCLGGNTSYLWHSSDSGKSWAELANGDATLRRMDFFGRHEAWFYGLNNNIYKTPLTASVEIAPQLQGQLYPNPFNQELILELEEAISTLKIVDIQGKELFEVHHLPAGRHVLTTDYFPKGLLFVQVQTKSGWHVRKMLKN